MPARTRRAGDRSGAQTRSNRPRRGMAARRRDQYHLIVRGSGVSTKASLRPFLVRQRARRSLDLSSRWRGGAFAMSCTESEGLVGRTLDNRKVPDFARF